MKKFAALFLLLIGQSVSAQYRDWQIETNVDVMDDSVTVELSKNLDKMEGNGIAELTVEFGNNREVSITQLSTLTIICNESIGFPMVDVTLVEKSGLMEFPRGLHEVTYRIGTDEPISHKWLSIDTALTYQALYISDGSNSIGANDATALVATMVQDNSRFIVRTSLLDKRRVTAIWNIEGLAEVIDQCMAVFD